MAAALKFLPRVARAPLRSLLWGCPVARLASGMALAEQAQQLFKSAVGAMLPGPMLHRTLSLDPGGKQLKIRDRSFQLQQNLYLVGFGKAVLGMAAAAEELLGQHLVQGVISVPKGIRAAMEHAGKQEMLLKPHSRVQVFEGAEDNLPDRDSLRAALAIQHLAEGLTADDLLLVLISGGGSALLPAPIPPVTLEEKQTLTKLLAARGATIQELNTIRKALSQLKGGGLAQAAYPAQVVSLILSDVVGDPVEVIASGPTVASAHNVQDCLHILNRYGLRAALPRSVKTVLARADSDPYGPHTCGHVLNVIIGSNALALAEAQRQAEVLGYQALVLSAAMEGDVRSVAQFYGLLAQVAGTRLTPSIAGTSVEEHAKLHELAAELQIPDLQLEEALEAVAEARGPVCLLAGGEPTVQLQGSGKGGRNQELAMRVGAELGRWSLGHVEVLFLSGGTDGQDGPTEAAGAWVMPELASQAAAEGLDMATFLAHNDSHSFFCRLQGGTHLLHTGLTGTNVMDVHLLFLRPR
ncbi:glycerate kinase isoform X1 [Nycticebus coucang]|uniref:glycerate kinase isoform X1 n=1 Tax=Nycticebus coucang TaxID=9470 RepID=UPI00234D88DC|nr:glycerate kinase isoform X1 [Nycticebus coucang]XP_053455985.1 glycerate kinase isoform X1 [Nycticebus coucang]XP_053455986.1 glycerate kinase isoform X1 [Nycticebus coucang]XP_053455987.1 glycerate kinase isoform X1 [Nycticebus coucang]XP_053455988.1 glycerate kinase isoform X1 [Nycticebus coucang]